MDTIKFKFNHHPGDFLRNTDITDLPNPDNDLQTFLLWFLKDYQSDDRIAYLDDLYKLFNDENPDDSNYYKYILDNGIKTKSQIKEEINLLEEKLKDEGYRNFYHLFLNRKIEII